MVEGDEYEAPAGVATASTFIDEVDGRMVIARQEDVEPLIEHLASLRNETSGKSATGEMYHVGDIPAVVVEAYLNENGVTWNEFLNDTTHVRRILMDPDFAKFRVWEGRF